MRGLRGLAAAAGVGAAMLTGCGIAAADSGSRDASPSVDNTPGAASGSVRPARGAPAAARTARVPSAGPRAGRDAKPSEPAVPTPRRGRPAPTPVPEVEPESVMPAAAIDATARTGPAAVTVRPVAPTPPATAAPAPAAVPPAPWRPSLRPPLRIPAPAAASPLAWSPPAAMSATIPVSPSTSIVTLALGATTLFHMAVVMTAAALNPAPPSPFTVTPTLNLNGFNLVPRSTREVTSFYGRWAYPPGAPAMVQGRQQFEVVDPNADAPVGTFDALVGRSTGFDYTGLLVTSAHGANVGTGAGQVPPVGSLITRLNLGPIGFHYSSLAAPAGNVVSFSITTPFGEIPVVMPFDAAKGIADRTVDNRPVGLGNGFSIAPADPDGETLTAISGLLPAFTTVQGHQVFNVNDAAGDPVGSFDGVFTTTSDLVGIYTQAIMVTGNDGTNVGTGAGQVPPVGSVYNVIYLHSDDHYYVYASLPSASGTDISVIEVNKGKSTRSLFTLIDASTPPSTEPMWAAGGYRLVPVTDLVPSGVNGLPPRDVQIQGYQRFDVHDDAGARIGTVDANVFTQWDALGIRSRAVMVTGRSPDSAAGVPPVGSVFNTVTSGESGFGAAHSVVPLESGDLTYYSLMTPWGDIPMPSTLRPAVGRTPVEFYSPFRV